MGSRGAPRRFRWNRAAITTACMLSAAACASTKPAPDAPAPNAAPIAAPAPPPPARCSEASRAEAEALADRDPSRGAAALQDELTCPQVPASTYVLLADLQSGRGGPGAALQTLRAATRRHADSTLIWRALGRTALRHGSRREGLSALERARDLSPQDAEVSAELARAYRDHREQDAGARTTVDPLLAKAQARFLDNDHKGALEILQSALRAAKGAPRVQAEVWRWLALVHLADGALPAAKAAAEAGLAAAVAPDALRSALLVTHADICLAQDRPDDALIAATAAVEITPRDPLAHANIALARALRKESKQALSALAMAIETGLPKQLTRSELLGLAGFASLRDRPAFQGLVERGWPEGRASGQPAQRGEKPTRDR